MVQPGRTCCGAPPSGALRVLSTTRSGPYPLKPAVPGLEHLGGAVLTRPSTVIHPGSWTGAAGQRHGGSPGGTWDSMGLPIPMRPLGGSSLGFPAQPLQMVRCERSALGTGVSVVGEPWPETTGTRAGPPGFAHCETTRPAPSKQPTMMSHLPSVFPPHTTVSFPLQEGRIRVLDGHSPAQMLLSALLRCWDLASQSHITGHSPWAPNTHSLTHIAPQAEGLFGCLSCLVSGHPIYTHCAHISNCVCTGVYRALRWPLPN